MLQLCLLAVRLNGLCSVLNAPGLSLTSCSHFLPCFLNICIFALIERSFKHCKSNYKIPCLTGVSGARAKRLKSLFRPKILLHSAVNYYAEFPLANFPIILS